jgi:hypothetical protein
MSMMDRAPPFLLSLEACRWTGSATVTATVSTVGHSVGSEGEHTEGATAAVTTRALGV